MAGAGYKLFNTGDVLTAAQVNTYLQEQVVMRFANATARTTALSGVLAEGMVSYLDDTNALEVYDGSAWVSTASGDITEVTAGTGISGGGSSGAVTITNSMATAIDAKGDLVVGTGADTFARLAVGANDTLLVAASGETTGLKWNTAATQFPWTAWTPTTSGITIGNGTVTARYQQIGKLVICRFDFLLGSTSSVTGDVYFSVPVSVASPSRVTGFGLMFASVGVVPAIPEISGSNLYLRASLANATYVIGQATSSTVPGTWTTNNWIAANCVYEAA